MAGLLHEFVKQLLSKFVFNSKNMPFTALMGGTGLPSESGIELLSFVEILNMDTLDKYPILFR